MTLREEEGDKIKGRARQGCTLTGREFEVVLFPARHPCQLASIHGAEAAVRIHPWRLSSATQLEEERPLLKEAVGLQAISQVAPPSFAAPGEVDQRDHHRHRHRSSRCPLTCPSCRNPTPPLGHPHVKPRVFGFVQGTYLPLQGAPSAHSPSSAAQRRDFGGN